ncbi:hypothetical protein GOBAR_AA05760 [Gossypium barbadense]|uniref:Uncharacterized protein n=1 Tax=Gossypium barbadense TaxID=3634 RepID=A0A2P5YGZ5_GOSBA|nr:hypothetical protein GOBAR_AA05760 [Gossypium barbadense]
MSPPRRRARGPTVYVGIAWPCPEFSFVALVLQVERRVVGMGDFKAAGNESALRNKGGKVLNAWKPRANAKEAVTVVAASVTLTSNYQREIVSLKDVRAERNPRVLAGLACWLRGFKKGRLKICLRDQVSRERRKRIMSRRRMSYAQRCVCGSSRVLSLCTFAGGWLRSFARGAST